MKSPKIIFLDRDGTIILDKNYLSQVEGIEWFPDTFSAIKIFQDLGCLIYILTNQSGIGRGYFTMKEVNAIHQQLQNDLKTKNLKPFEGFLICPHIPEDQCNCRKPNTQLVINILKKLNIAAEDAVVLGDKDSDVECGVNFGGKGILVRGKSGSLLDYAEKLKK